MFVFSVTNTEKRVENVMCSGVSLTNFEVLGNAVRQSQVFDITCQSKLTPRRKWRYKIAKLYAN